MSFIEKLKRKYKGKRFRSQNKRLTRRTEILKRMFYKQPEGIDILEKLATNSSKEAIKESKAHGLRITYLENGIVYSENPEGERTIIKSRTNKIKNSKLLKFKFEKGMIFHVRN